MKKETHYPSYDVMREQDEWDDHTQQIVGSRLLREQEYQFFALEEVESLKRICGDLVGDEREDIIQYVLGHLDQTLSSSIGEGQRKVGVPKGPILIREGLKAMLQSAEQKFMFPFIALNASDRRKLLEEVSTGQAPSVPEWSGIPQKEWFKKLLTLTIEAYYSHPTVWSEIGYGGPAYPRGYVRTQLGQLDPWEAKKENS